MYISLKDIQKLFEDTPSTLTDSKDSYCLSSFCLLSLLLIRFLRTVSMYLMIQIMQPPYSRTQMLPF